MSFIRQQITASGGTVDPFNFGGTYLSYEIWSSGSITLSTSFAITPSTDIAGAFFTVRWEADVTLAAFSVTICGEVINQDQVNQSGTFTCFYDGSAWQVQYFADQTDTPQNAQGNTNVTVPTSGTLTLTAGKDTMFQRFVGSPTVLAGNYVVTANTTGVKAGAMFYCYIGGSVTIGANSFTVFGVSLSATDASNGGLYVIAYYNGSSWIGAATSRQVSAADLSAQAALTVVANATNASAQPTAVPFSTDYGVLQRIGTSLVTSLLSYNNFNETDTFGLRYTSTAISSAAILTSFGSPVSVVQKITGKTLIPILFAIEGTYNAATYAANLNIKLAADTAAVSLAEQNGLLGFTSDFTTILYPVHDTSSFNPNTVFEKDIQFSTKTGNPTTGDGTLIVKTWYIAI